MDFVECGTDFFPETFVPCHVDGFEEASIKVEEVIDIKEESIKVEEAVDIKDEIPEATSFPPVEIEHEVSLCGVCKVQTAHSFRPFIASVGKL